MSKNRQLVKPIINMGSQNDKKISRVRINRKGWEKLVYLMVYW